MPARGKAFRGSAVRSSERRPPLYAGFSEATAAIAEECCIYSPCAHRQNAVRTGSPPSRLTRSTKRHSSRRSLAEAQTAKRATPPHAVAAATSVRAGACRRPPPCQRSAAFRRPTPACVRRRRAACASSAPRDPPPPFHAGVLQPKSASRPLQPEARKSRQSAVCASGAARRRAARFFQECLIWRCAAEGRRPARVSTPHEPANSEGSHGQVIPPQALVPRRPSSRMLSKGAHARRHRSSTPRRRLSARSTL